MFESYIYEEEIGFYQAELALEKVMIETDLTLDTVYFESKDESDDSDEKKESKMKKIFDTIIDTVKKFVKEVKEFLHKSNDKVVDRIYDAQVAAKIDNAFLSRFNNAIAKAEKNGMTTFKFFDIEKLMDYLKGETQEYKDLINEFMNKYMKSGSPKDAEKMLAKFKKIYVGYSKKVNDLYLEENFKTYKIKYAEKILDQFRYTKKGKPGEFSAIYDEYLDMCDHVENVIYKTYSSLDEYSEETGYIQNAKTLKALVHNSCVNIQVHVADASSKLIRYGIPLLTYIDKKANTEDLVLLDKDGNPVARLKNDTSSYERKKARESLAVIGKRGGAMTDAELKSLKKISRKKDLAALNDDDNDTPLKFDRLSKTSRGDVTRATKDAGKSLAFNTAAAAHELNHISKS